MNPISVHPRHSQAQLAGLVCLCALGTSALAETPQTAFLERAQTQASGAQVRSYGMPATDSTGKVLYWDVSVDLTIGANGKPLSKADVSSVKQAAVRSNRLVPGNYADGLGGSCTVYTTTLPSGRQEASGSCKNGVYVWNFTVDNGDIAGHPFELQLNNAKIGDIPGYRDYNWGVDGSTSNNYGSCFATNYIISARQVGPQMVFTRYAYDNIGDCGLTLTQVP